MLAICFLLVSSRAYSSAPKMEATHFSEMSVDFQQATQHYISEKRTLYIDICLQLSQYVYSGQATGWMTKEVRPDSC
jgi:hypothetical protein